MSSLKKRFDLAWSIIQGKVEADKEFLEEFCINGIAKIMENCGDQDLTVRCCFELWKKNGKEWIKCDSYCLPKEEFKTNCAKCYECIKEDLPQLKRAYDKFKG